MELRETFLYSVFAITIAATIGTVFYFIYLLNIEKVRYVHEQRMAEIESRAEREKNLLQQGFVIQDTGYGQIIWPIPIGHVEGYTKLEANN